MDSKKLTRRAVSPLAHTHTDVEAVAQQDLFWRQPDTRVDGATVRAWGDDAQTCPTGCRTLISHSSSGVSVLHTENSQPEWGEGGGRLARAWSACNRLEWWG